MQFGGTTGDISKGLSIPVSTVYDNLRKAKDDGVYNWELNKDLEIFNSYVREVNLDSYKKVVFLTDIHYPDNIDLGAIELFLKDYKPDILIYGGDFLDFRYLSKFDKENKLIIGDNLKKEYVAVGEIIDRHTRLAQPKEIYFIEGNHEYRMVRYLEKNPVGLGYLEVKNGLEFEKRGIKWIPFNELLKIGKIYYTHGIYHNMHHAKKHVESYMRNMVYGHTHAIQMYSGPHPTDRPIPYIAKSVGCLCNLNPEYMHNRPNQWAQAFHIAEFETDGNFSDTIIYIINNGFRIPGTGLRYETPVKVLE
jgi:predicted phosphodiesterase